MPVRCVVHLARPVADRQRWEFVLDESERDRLARFRKEEDKDRFVTGRAVAKMAIAQQLDVAVDEVVFTLHCAVCSDEREGPHGKPVAPGVEFSIAHSGDLVAVAISEAAPVGVDVELINDRTDIAALSRNVLCSSEAAIVEPLHGAHERAAFFTFWSRKEALLKSTGQGISVELSTVDASRVGPRHVAGSRVVLADLDLSDYDAHEDYRGALAVLTDEDVEVEYTHFAG